MADREKLKARFEELKASMEVGLFGTVGMDEVEAVLELIRETEPRVLTEEDVLHSTGKPLWFESRGMYLGLKGFWCLSFEVDPELHIRFVQSITGGKITLSLIDYGKAWRFWTSRPSEEQRKAVRWDAEP